MVGAGEYKCEMLAVTEWRGMMVRKQDKLVGVTRTDSEGADRDTSLTPLVLLSVGGKAGVKEGVVKERIRQGEGNVSGRLLIEQRLEMVLRLPDEMHLRG